MRLGSEPSVARKAFVLGGGLLAVAWLYAGARALGAHEHLAATLGSVALGVVTALLTGSLGEWVVHRYLMHRPLLGGPTDLPYRLHHKAHHWVQYPPDQYLQDDVVQRVPPGGEKTRRVCTTALGRASVVASHVAFYSVFAVLLALLPAFLLAGNAAFTTSVTATTAVLLFLFVHVHDAVHHPGLSPLERFRWFRFLDRHHYVHHVDTDVNTNFLLPLGDLLLGTLRHELKPSELAVWPSYEEARRRVVRPTFEIDGTKRRPGRPLAPRTPR